MNLAVGRIGEQRAQDYLRSHSFLLRHTNYRTKSGEIDIVAEKDNIVYFIEVKTRVGTSHGKPYEAVTYRKQQHMERSAQWYILQNKLQRSKLRLSVISIELLPSGETKAIAMFDL
jgi:putative endonuclease